MNIVFLFLLLSLYQIIHINMLYYIYIYIPSNIIKNIINGIKDIKFCITILLLDTKLAKLSLKINIGVYDNNKNTAININEVNEYFLANDIELLPIS